MQVSKYSESKFFENLMSAPEIPEEQLSERERVATVIELVSQYTITKEHIKELSWDDINDAFKTIKSCPGYFADDKYKPHHVIDMVMIERAQDNLEAITPIKQVYRRHFL